MSVDGIATTQIITFSSLIATSYHFIAIPVPAGVYPSTDTVKGGPTFLNNSNVALTCNSALSTTADQNGHITGHDGAVSTWTQGTGLQVIESGLNMDIPWTASGISDDNTPYFSSAPGGTTDLFLATFIWVSS